jgi:hypothetical protein
MAPWPCPGASPTRKDTAAGGFQPCAVERRWCRCCGFSKCPTRSCRPRQKRLTQAETAEALRLLGRLPIQVDDRSGLPLASDVVVLARRYTLTAYDAAYLELALRLRLPIATLDRRLQRAAKAAGAALQPT